MMITHWSFDGLKMFLCSMRCINNSKFEIAVVESENLLLEDSISTIAADIVSLLP